MFDTLAKATSISRLLLLFATWTSASIWTPDLDYGPAPSPEDGPPLSANASRNPALLKYQVPGIIAGYLGFVLLVGTLALTYGRRRRRAAQASAGFFAREMVKPIDRPLESSSHSRTWSSQSWGSPKNIINKFQRKSDIMESVSSVPQSPPAFDAKVVEQDKRDRQLEMERLYAAVVHEEKNYATGLNSPSHVRKISASSFSQPHPPNHQINEVAISSSSSNQTPTPRKDIVAIYPRDDAPPLPPTPRGFLPPEPRSASSRQQATPHSPVGPSSPTLNSPVYSIASSTASKQTRQNRSSRKTFRGLNISAPIQRYPASNDSLEDIDASTPLTPRIYDPGPPPPTPPFQRGGYGDEEGNESDIIDDYDNEDIDAPRPLPNPAPQRTFSYKSDASTLHNNEPTYGRPSNSTKDLPLRGLTNNSYLSPTSPRMQTTVIEQRQLYQPYGPANGMWSSGLQPNGMWSAGHGGHRTAGLVTPHSPYMPFSPVTPVTPHLQTRRERKQSKKEAARAPIARDNDLVKDDKELWGTAY